MNADEFRKALKLEVDLFKMRNGSEPHTIHVSHSAYKLLAEGTRFGVCSHFCSANVMNILPSEHLAAELWLGGQVSMHYWGHAPLLTPDT